MKDVSGLESILQTLNNKSKSINVGLKESFPKTILNMLILLVIISVLAVIAVVLIKLYHSYPRSFWIGHSENLKKYMEDHVRLLVKCLHDLRYSSTGELSTIINDLFRLGCVPDKDLSTYSPRDAPFMYLPYMFRRALIGSKEPNKGELSLYSRLMGSDTLTLYGNEISVYEEDSDNGQVKDSVIKEIRERVIVFAELEHYMGKLMCSYKGSGEYDDVKRKCTKAYKWCSRRESLPDALSDPKAEMSRMTLLLLVHEYAPVLERMYDLRKSGGLGNFVIYNIYMSQYITFIFHEKIPDIWDNFLDDVKKTGESFLRVAGSAKVSSFMSSLPLKLIGQIDSFEDIDDDSEKEGFFTSGFGNMFKGLLKLIPNLLKILLALVQVITNPLKIIQYILAMVLGLLLYILYMILITLSPLFYVPAFFWILSFKVIMTILWVALFVSLGLFYFILWILNQGTGGVVFDMLRCENLPDAWHKTASYVFGNRYVRNLFCKSPCSAGWLPGGCLCTKSPKFQPPLCPQQLVMTRFLEHALGRPPRSGADAYFEFKPDTAYLNASQDQRKKMVRDFVDNEFNFSQKCASGTSIYDFITRFACENARELGIKDPEFMKACKHCYCKRFFSANCKERDRTQNKLIYLRKTSKKCSTGVPLNQGDLKKLQKQAIQLDPQADNMGLLYPRINEVVYLMPAGEGEAFPGGNYLPSFCDQEGGAPGRDASILQALNLSGKLPNDNKVGYYVVYSFLILVTAMTGIALLTKKINGA